MKTTFCLLAAASFLTVGVLADRPVRTPTKAELVGSWVGYDDDYPYFYRLNLLEDGTGRLILLRPAPRTDIYNVNQWELSGSTLLMQISPESNSSETVTCSIKSFDYLRMTILIKGTTNRWERTASLLNEKKLLRDMAESAPNGRNNGAVR
jgi:hypothetical protein